ncbi:MAG: arginine--tRNA ligase [Planctomycetes bacterium]|nr:arginine--tRNA ligase [Planctomycetota bacterium]
MNILRELRRRFAEALGAIVDDPGPLLDLIRPAQDARFGDYQANCAMPLAKRLHQSARDVAESLVARLRVGDLCDRPEVTERGFINMRLRDDWLDGWLRGASADPRVAIEPTASPRAFVIDYSSPNVAKPMHVGHIRSTVIGDAIRHILAFLGHTIVSDNHLGDWGTQFGMIIYGYKHFLDRRAYEKHRVDELGRLYKLVNQLAEYHELKERLPKAESDLARMDAQRADLAARVETLAGPERKKVAKDADRLDAKIKEAREEIGRIRARLAAVDDDPVKRALAREHPAIGERVLEETARLHEGDAGNRRLWAEFLPDCRLELAKAYQRLGIRFDYELGESFYHDFLGKVVAEFESRGLARTSEGATCVFLDGFETPMIVRKSDGAFLYATTDLATIQYRMATWHPDAVLYVVDSRQSEHFAKLFAAARLWGYDSVELRHVSFGTVLGEDGKPYKTREGDAVSLASLLDEAVARAYRVVCTVDDAKPSGRELSDEQRRRVAEVVGIGAIKYRDLSHNRTSDYVFSFDKMLELDGNTSAYLQYAFARVHAIFARGGIERPLPAGTERSADAGPPFPTVEERALAMALARFHETLDDVTIDYRPNMLTTYLYELAGHFSRFYTNPQCKVLKAETAELREQRLRLCDVAGRTIGQGLRLLGIQTVDQM